MLFRSKYDLFWGTGQSGWEVLGISKAADGQFLTSEIIYQKKTFSIGGVGGRGSTMVGILAFGPTCPRFDSKHPRISLEEKIIDVAEINPWHCLEESGQWLENLDQTHIMLHSGKPALQSNIS